MLKTVLPETISVLLWNSLDDLSLRCSLERVLRAQFPVLVLPAEPESGKAKATPSNSSLLMLSLSPGSRPEENQIEGLQRKSVFTYLLNLFQGLVTVSFNVSSLGVLQMANSQMGSNLEEPRHSMYPQV